MGAPYVILTGQISRPSVLGLCILSGRVAMKYSEKLCGLHETHGERINHYESWQGVG
jgi:hypothetical protein